MQEITRTNGVLEHHKKIAKDLLAMWNDDDLSNGVEIKLVVDRIWESKKRNMSCQRIGCNKMAKDMTNGHLFVCKGCKMARYCSKRCQKKDWKDGNHKETCFEYSDLQIAVEFFE